MTGAQEDEADAAADVFASGLEADVRDREHRIEIPRPEQVPFDLLIRGMREAYRNGWLDSLERHGGLSEEHIKRMARFLLANAKRR